MTKLFDVGSDGLIQLNKVWIDTIAEFRTLLRRDRGSEGDAQGRKKLQATREFTYIYHLCDPASPNWKLDGEKEKAVQARKDAGLPPEWQPDDEVLAAQVRYEDFFKTLPIETIFELRQTLQFFRTSVKSLEDAVRTSMQDEDAGVIMANSKSILDTIKGVVAMRKDLIPVINQLLKYEAELYSEASSDTRRYGDVEEGAFEDPDMFLQ